MEHTNPQWYTKVPHKEIQRMVLPSVALWGQFNIMVK